jgi:hypothetical protein
MKDIERRLRKLENGAGQGRQPVGVGIETVDGEEELDRQITQYYESGGTRPFVVLEKLGG